MGYPQGTGPEFQVVYADETVYAYPSLFLKLGADDEGTEEILEISWANGQTTTYGMLIRPSPLIHLAMPSSGFWRCPHQEEVIRPSPR